MDAMDAMDAIDAWLIAFANNRQKFKSGTFVKLILTANHALLTAHKSWGLIAALEPQIGIKCFW